MKAIQSLLLRKDNYSYFLRYGKNVLVIDPSEAKPILSIAKKENLFISHILNTHHHEDHIAGNKEIVETHGSFVIGPQDPLIPSLDKAVSDQDTLDIGPYTIQVLASDGHLAPHLCSHLPQEKALFSGDLLFGAGVGRLFENTEKWVKAMWESLQKISCLDEDTSVYPGHEYTKVNLAFAKKVDPKKSFIEERASAIKNGAKELVPFSLGEEKKTNPFLRPRKKL